MRACFAGGSLAVAAFIVCDRVRAEGVAPPWVASDDVPLAPWARSIAPKSEERGQPGDLVLFAGPSSASGRRGLSAKGATLPIYGAKRGPGCVGRWWLVGPLAWACSDGADVSADEPSAGDAPTTPRSLPFRYFFVGRAGASAYASPEAAQDGAADRELESGSAVAVPEQVAAGSPASGWVRTNKGLWIALADLVAARPSEFQGVEIGPGPLDIGWVTSERAEIRSPSPKGKASRVLQRFDLVHVLPPMQKDDGAWLRIGEQAWMRAADLTRPTVTTPPRELMGARERWIDVSLSTQTLVAYEGAQPVFVTLISTGRGPMGSPNATPVGVHRIWVKLLMSDMRGGADDDANPPYSLEDVPYVQFFDGAVGLHGTYWHRDFGRVHSHGCVNLAPLDARWLFGFTVPRLPLGWVAAYPAAVDEGTIVRVR